MVGEALSGVGGLIQGIGSIYSAKQQAKAQRQAEQNKQNNIANAKSALNDWNTQASGMLDNYDNQVASALGNITNLSNAGDLQKYQQMRDNMDSSNYVYDFDQFDSSKYNVDDYVNQNKDAILKDTANAFQATAAGAGLGHSSGTATGMMNAVADKSESLYNDAYNRMNQDKSFDYTQYQNYINNMQNKLNTQLQIDTNNMNNLRSDLQFDNQNTMNKLQLQQDQMNNRLGLGNSIAQSKASLV